MISSIRLRNWQAHRSLLVRLAPGVTTITGPNDVGKSAILRALRWAALNKPSGSGFIRHGSRVCKVHVTTQNGCVVRTKGANRNSYEVDGKELVAFGADPPPEVAAALELQPINFQQQHDAAFWFSQTAGGVSRELNRVVNLSVIDTTLAALASDLRRSAMKADVIQTRLDAAKRERQRHRCAVAANRALCMVENLAQEAIRLGRRATLLAELVRCATAAKRATRAATRTARDARKVVELGEACTRVGRRASTLHSLVETATRLTDAATRATPNPSPVGQRCGYWLSLQKRTKALRQLLFITREQKSHLWTLQKRIASAQHSLDAIKTCPTCGQPLPRSSRRSAPTSTSR